MCLAFLPKKERAFQRSSFMEVTLRVSFACKKSLAKHILKGLLRLRSSFKNVDAFDC